MYIDLIIQQEEVRIFEEQQETDSLRTKRLILMIELLENLNELVIQGNQNKNIKYLAQYAVNVLLNNLDSLENIEELNFGILLKALSIIESKVFLRQIEIQKDIINQIISSLLFTLQNHSYTLLEQTSESDITKEDLLRLIQ